MKNINIAAIFGVPVLALVMATNAQATVTMQLNQGLTYTYSEAGFSASLSGNPMITGNDLIGIYAFNIQAGGSPSLASPLYAICVSPQGILDWNSHQYNSETLQDAGNGQYPSAWASGGIQNANYLFTQLSRQITGGGIVGQSGTTLADQGAGLALAMYSALYNSTGLGAVNLKSGPFTIDNPSGNVLADYTADLKDVNGANVTPVVGSLLLGVNDDQYGGSGQEQIYLSGASMHVTTPVPELSTIFAGALMLLPFGVSALRILRKSRTA